MRLRSYLMGTGYSALWYLLLVIALPIASLAILGLLYLWEHKGLLLVSAGWLFVSAVGFAIIRWNSHQAARDRKAAFKEADSESAPGPTSPEPTLPEQLDTPSQWSDKDAHLWEHYCEVINELVAGKPAWDELPAISLELLANIANEYHAPRGATPSERDIYRFTLPEALQVLAVASARYRELLITHVPFAERVNVSSLLGFYKHKAALQTGWGWFNKTRRIWRLTNPLAAAIGELRDQFTNRLFNSFSDNLQNDLKRLLLQEVLQAGIDLYSGRLKHTDEEMNAYQSKSQRMDSSQLALPQEPMRLILLGQISAGKSSLINALIQGIEAEVDHLPTTENRRTHVLSLSDSKAELDQAENGVNQCMHLIDTPGLGTTEKDLKALADNARDADLIIYVARANQPARAPDNKLMSLILEQFSQQPRRRQPPIVLALTHIDQLSPRSEWAPPYDLNSDNKKARSIVQALDSAGQQIGLPPQSAAIPLCLSADKGLYNVDAIVAKILMVREEAIFTQLNRRRLERGDQAASWGEQWSTLVRLGRAAGRAVSTRRCP